MIVLERQLLAAGRPLEIGEVGGASGRKRDDARLRQAGLVADHELVLAARVGQPRELRAVRATTPDCARARTTSA